MDRKGRRKWDPEVSMHHHITGEIVSPSPPSLSLSLSLSLSVACRSSLVRGFPSQNGTAARYGTPQRRRPKQNPHIPRRKGEEEKKREEKGNMSYGMHCITIHPDLTYIYTYIHAYIHSYIHILHITNPPSQVKKTTPSKSNKNKRGGVRARANPGVFGNRPRTSPDANASHESGLRRLGRSPDIEVRWWGFYFYSYFSSYLPPLHHPSSSSSSSSSSSWVAAVIIPSGADWELEELEQLGTRDKELPTRTSC
jgi:hypothetical protein